MFEGVVMMAMMITVTVRLYGDDGDGDGYIEQYTATHSFILSS